MSILSISSTTTPSVSGRFAVHYGHYRKEVNQSPPTVVADSSAAAAEPLASAIAAALTQVGLISRPNSVGSENTATATDSSFASLPLQQAASQQIQQYRSVASTSSNLAQALRASSGDASNGAGNLTTVLQSLWTSLGSSSDTASDSPGSTMPSLQSFSGALARSLSESGVTGLRGVFVDAVA